MRFYYITFRSITFAQRGEALLQSAGIACSLQRTPRYMEQQGCGYTIRVYEYALQQALAILHRHKVAFRKVYLQLENGVMEEIKT